jgi:membrane protein DedA with SNARE-associated domain
LGTSSRSFRRSSRDTKTLFFLVAILALFLALSEILEFTELPFESLAGNFFASGSMTSVQFVTSSMTGFGYIGLFVLMFLESASLPIPSEVVLPFAGYLVFVGSMNFVSVVLVGTLAGLAGALADYYLAFKLGRPVVQKLFKWVGMKPEHLERAEMWLDTRGSWSILVSRFIPGLRSSISFPAGALRMRLRGFVITTAIGAFGWSALLVYLGYSAGSLWQTALAKSASVLPEAAIFAVGLASASYIVYFAFLKATRSRVQ